MQTATVVRALLAVAALAVAVHGVDVPTGTTFQYQLLGTIDTSIDAELYVVDLYDTPVNKINTLKSLGRTVICYFSAGSYEDWRTDASDFPKALIGNPLDGWDGEWWLDIRNIGSSALRGIMRGRMELAVSKGCDGVDPDNVDGFTNDSGFPLKAADQVAYNTWLANTAHDLGLLVNLKNCGSLATQLSSVFDFVVTEQCFQYNECDIYSPFANKGKAILNIEYRRNTSRRRCKNAKQLGVSFIKKKLSLRARPYKRCK
eukprot:m.38842 g.38842  ORF g.38842 m.38842 type:complete len:259 (+) comp10249_c0_seq4:82-858(+)